MNLQSCKHRPKSKRHPWLQVCSMLGLKQTLNRSSHHARARARRTHAHTPIVSVRPESSGQALAHCLALSRADPSHGSQLVLFRHGGPWFAPPNNIMSLSLGSGVGTRIVGLDMHAHPAICKPPHSYFFFSFSSFSIQPLCTAILLIFFVDPFSGSLSSNRTLFSAHFETSRGLAIPHSHRPRA